VNAVAALTVAISERGNVDARDLTAIFSAIFANNCAGGWRKLRES